MPIVTGVTSDTLGQRWVSDGRNRSLMRYSETGSIEEEVGSPGQLVMAEDIAVAQNGTVWTVDHGCHLVKVYDQQGSLKLSFGGQGSDTGQFDQPSGIALGPTREIRIPHGDTWYDILQPAGVYVADKLNHRVQPFDSAGRYQYEFGNSVLSPPVSLCRDSAGWVLVADAGTKALWGTSAQGAG